MYRSLRLLYTTLAVVTVTTVPSCRSSNAFDIDERVSDRVLLTVKNGYPLDVDIYALSTGLPTRIGTVTVGSTARFALDPTLYNASDFRIVAAPIGGNGRGSSGPLIVRRGDAVDFTVGITLAQSHAEVR